MYVVGLTGPAGAGKSVVLAMVRELGADSLRADAASRELLSSDSRLLFRIREHLGDGVFRDNGSLDRGRTAALIFANDAARAQLDTIMHPPMLDWLRERLTEFRRRECPPEIVVLEAAILTHMGARQLVDAVVRVHAPRDECLARLQARDHLTPEEAATRLAVHERLGLFSEPADYVLDTSGSLEQTRHRVTDLWDRLLEAARRKRKRAQ